MELSIIIPVWEDREACLAVVPGYSVQGEVIVVDASQDRPLESGELPEDVVLVRSPKPHRACQMNLGAEKAQGDWLLFVHADTEIPDESFSALRCHAERDGLVGGGFARRFSGQSKLLSLTCRLADWRGRMWGYFFGDQAIFARKAAFEEVGGYRKMRLFEDLDLCRRLMDLGGMELVAPPIVSSNRRFQDGLVTRVWKDFVLTTNYFFREKDAYLEE